MSLSLKRKRSDAAPGARPGPDPGPAEDRPEPRKVVAACTACRKQKVKCDMPSEEPPCARCERKALACVLHTSALRNPSGDHKQINLLSRDVSNIFSTLQLLCNKLGAEAPKPLVSAEATTNHDGTEISTNRTDGAAQHDEPAVYELSPPVSPSTVQAPIDPYLSSGPPKDGDATDTAGPMSPLNSRMRRASSEGADLITKGVISHEQAETLVQRYLLHLDRFLYGISSHYRDANHVRKASPTLLAAMCAVSAFQNIDNRDLFEACYREYRCLVSTSLFEKRSLEYIRALCIGSFWLLDSSRILLSDAIRRAADTRLHHHFHRLMGEQAPSDEDARDELRLWYLLFVSDRHLSVLYNRDALIRQEKDAIENRDSFLTASNSVKSSSGDPAPSNPDIRLISQVSLLVIMGQIRDVLGSERASPLPKTFVVQFSHFNHELDQWFEKYSPSFEPDPHIGTFPLAGLTMHAHYAKLYLSHHIFHGLDKDHPIPLHFLPAAMASREAAHNIFSLLLENSAFRDNIIGMPHYFHIMISFAGHFLLEVAMKHRDQLGISVQDDFDRVAAMLAVYARMPVMPQHPIARVLVGLTRKLQECTASLGLESMLTGSPFQKVDLYTSFMKDLSDVQQMGGGGTATGGENIYGSDAAREPSTLASLDMQQAMMGLPNGFLFSDFGDFHLNIPVTYHI